MKLLPRGHDGEAGPGLFCGKDRQLTRRFKIDDAERSKVLDAFEAQHLHQFQGTEVAGTQPVAKDHTVAQKRFRLAVDDAFCKAVAADCVIDAFVQHHKDGDNQHACARGTSG